MSDSSIVFYFASLFFVLGAIWGSFFNVCIFRIPRGLSVVKPGSHCFSCGKPVSWFDNIPILSYLILRGKCRHCGAGFSAQYCLVEFLTGILFLCSYLHWGLSWNLLLYIPSISLLIIGAGIDLKHFILPDFTTLGGLIYVLLVIAVFDFLGMEYPVIKYQRDMLLDFFHLPIPQHYLFLLSFLGALLGGLLFFFLGVMGKVVFKKEAMGGGDVKLIAFLGALTGPVGVLFVTFLSSLVGSVVGLAAMSMGKKANAPEDDSIWKDEDFSFMEKGFYLPFGPFLAAGGILMLFIWRVMFRYFFGG